MADNVDESATNFVDLVDKPDLSPKQYIALEALLAGRRPAEAARLAGVSPTTVYRWQTEAAFGRELRQLEGAALQGLGRRLLGLGELVGGALEEALAPDMPMTIRLRAADIVTSRLLAMAELSQVIGRIEALEAKAGGVYERYGD